MGFEDGEDDDKKGRWDPRTKVTLHWPDSSQCPRGKGSWGPRGRYALSTGGSKPVPLRGVCDTRVAATTGGVPTRTEWPLFTASGNGFHLNS